MALVIGRKAGQEIVIDEQTVLRIVRVSGGQVTVAIEAPRAVRVRRGEIQPRKAA